MRFPGEKERDSTDMDRRGRKGKEGRSSTGREGSKRKDVRVEDPSTDAKPRSTSNEGLGKGGPRSPRLEQGIQAPLLLPTTGTTMRETRRRASILSHLRGECGELRGSRCVRDGQAWMRRGRRWKRIHETTNVRYSKAEEGERKESGTVRPHSTR